MVACPAPTGPSASLHTERSTFRRAWCAASRSKDVAASPGVSIDGRRSRRGSQFTIPHGTHPRPTWKRAVAPHHVVTHETPSQPFPVGQEGAGFGAGSYSCARMDDDGAGSGGSWSTGGGTLLLFSGTSAVLLWSSSSVTTPALCRSVA